MACNWKLVDFFDRFGRRKVFFAQSLTLNENELDINFFLQWRPLVDEKVTKNAKYVIKGESMWRETTIWTEIESRNYIISLFLSFDFISRKLLFADQTPREKPIDSCNRRYRWIVSIKMHLIVFFSIDCIFNSKPRRLWEKFQDLTHKNKKEFTLLDKMEN